MSDIEDLVKELLEQKPELDRAAIEERIKQKKEKIGAGYLSDCGAVFLIAGEYGITLSEPLKAEIKLKDLYAGAKEVSLEARVLNISPVKQYSRKDGSQFYLRTATIYDKESTVSVKLWDEKASLPIVEELKPGDLIKVIKAYVKSDFDGSPTVNIGSSSSIEMAAAGTDSDIPSIDMITKDVSELREGQKDQVVSGIINGPINGIEFTNSRGQPGKALKMTLKGKDERSMKIVLWGKDESSVPNMISQSAKIRLLGVRTKGDNQGMEIHGNEATIVQVEGEREAESIIARIISISTTEDGRRMIFGVDAKDNRYNISDTSDSSKSCVEGDVVDIMPSKAHGNSVTLDSNSLVRKMDNDENIPSLSQLRTKINDVKAGEGRCIEAIVLKTPERREIQTKTGEMVLLSEMFVEDDTGSIWVKGWRNQARHIDRCELGEIVSITGLSARAGLEGKLELVLTLFSKITKKS